MSIAGATVVSFAVGSLRVGAQLPIAAVAQAAILCSLVLAFVSAARALRTATFNAALAP